MPRARVRDIELHYERGGRPSGPPVLLISGTGGDLRQEPSILGGPLAATFDLLAYDQRGLGRSDKPDAAYTMADYGQDAMELLDAVAWDRCAVLGISFGGMVAQEMALLAPRRVTRLVLCCTSSGGSGGSSYPLHELDGLPQEERLARHLGLMDSRWDASWQAANPAIVDLMRARAGVGPQDADAIAGARRQLEARATHDTYARLGQLTMPTLVCAGRFDAIAPLANAEALAAQIPSAVLQVFDGGHAFLFQDPTAWPAIAEFLAAGQPST
ncbi:MAG: alpha/beta fold hydrolase [Actinobacteria bacterium]|nr:MAG: alpha/beta fold hydrolase [Actinomycetota bacterium]